MTAIVYKFAAITLVAAGFAWGVSQVLESLHTVASALGS